MSGQAPFSPRLFPVIQEDPQGLKNAWFFFLFLGVCLIVVGAVALIYAAAAAKVTVFVYGWFLLVGGIVYIVGAFFTRAWGGLFLSLLAGVLYFVCGIIFINNPEEVAVLLALFMGIFFIVEGLFRIISAATGQFRHWGLMLLNGLVTLLLGILIWQKWPYDGPVIVGIFVGIDLIFSGAAYVSLGLAARNLSA
jgi:uncharacterized membrane protein HdeD (DUF308 family)